MSTRKAICQYLYVFAVILMLLGAIGCDDHRSHRMFPARFVTFSSDATNLVTGDTNGSRDVFVHDRLTGETKRVSVSSAGAEATGGYSRWSKISGP
jgi:hypothetical protein